MRARITPHYTQLVHDACLKSFWRRKRLAQFLRACGVPPKYLATWSSDETKRDLLDRLFDDLVTRQDGRRLILRIAGSLIEQTSFPDLENWEDSDHKKEQAQRAVHRLRVHQAAQEAEIQDERSRKETQARFRKHQERAAQAQTTLQKLTERLDELSERPGTSEAGYDFEDWFYDLADFAEVQNKRPYATCPPATLIGRDQPKRLATTERCEAGHGLTALATPSLPTTAVWVVGHRDTSGE